MTLRDEAIALLHHVWVALGECAWVPQDTSKQSTIDAPVRPAKSR
jgi:hypothetical protein